MPLRVKKATCTGCKLCQLACSGWHNGAFNPEKARLKVSHKYDKSGIQISISYCNQCGKCVDTCQVEAIFLNGSWVLVDHSKCIGCKTCLETCPLDAVHYDGKEKSVICNLCEGSPRCVEWCPKGIIYLKEKKSLTGRAANE